LIYVSVDLERYVSENETDFEIIQIHSTIFKDHQTNDNHLPCLLSPIMGDKIFVFLPSHNSFLSGGLVSNEIVKLITQKGIPLQPIFTSSSSSRTLNLTSSS